MTYLECLKAGESLLAEAKIDDYDFDARELLIHTSGLSRGDYFTSMQKEVPLEVYKTYKSVLNERINGTPLQYIIGSWDFYGLEFKVGPGVLIPRPETEILVDLAVEHLNGSSVSAPVVCDLCAGTGCVGISIASQIPNSKVYEFEYSDDAFKYLEQNINSSCEAIKYDVLKGPKAFVEKYGVCPDVIVSNPPYIPSKEIESLQSEVQLEPHMALDGGEDGLVFYRKIIDEWLSILKPNGILAMECAEDQADDIAALIEDKIMSNEVLSRKTVFKTLDFAGIQRVVGLK